jgi:hypothetical protein
MCRTLAAALALVAVVSCSKSGNQLDDLCRFADAPVTTDQQATALARDLQASMGGLSFSRNSRNLRISDAAFALVGDAGTASSQPPGGFSKIGPAQDRLRTACQS